MARTIIQQVVPSSQSVSDQLALRDARRGEGTTVNANLVRSFIRSRGVPARPSEYDNQAVMILGTATRGEVFKPIIADPADVQDVYGDIPQAGTLRETSLTKGVLELSNSIRVARNNIIAVRIGNAKKARLLLKEGYAFARNRGGTANPDYDKSDRAIVDNDFRYVSLILESLEEGDRFNNITATIINRLFGTSSISSTTDEAVNYYSVRFSGLPDGQDDVVIDNLYIGRTLTHRRNPANLINAAQLAARINADPILSQYIVASTSFLNKDIQILIADEEGGIDPTKKALKQYTDIHPLHPSVIDSDVDFYVTISESTFTGSILNIYDGTPLDGTEPSDEIIHSLIAQGGVALTGVTNSGSYGPTVSSSDVGRLICIRPQTIADDASSVIPQWVKDVYGYYEFTKSGTMGNSISTSPTHPDAPNTEEVPLPSWGDNLSYLRSVSFLSGSDIQIPAGSTTFDLPRKPTKVLTPGTETIDQFIRRQVGERVFTIGPKIDLSSDITGTLSYISESSYNASGLFTSLTERTISGVTQRIADDVDVFLIKAGANTALTNETDTNVGGLVKDTDYSFDRTTGAFTWLQSTTTTHPLELGDVVIVSYRYEVTYGEAKLRSELAQGNPITYFVTGRQIIFGAAQPTALEISFKSNNRFGVSEVTIVDAIEFDLRFNRQDLTPGAKVAISFAFTPELPTDPGPDDEAINGVYRFSQGSDGTYGASPEDKAEYKQELIRAYRLVGAWPCSMILPVGAYLDDIVEGYNFETGLPEPANAGFHIDLLNAVSDKSENIRECVGMIATRPLNTVSPSPIQIRNWIDRHIEVDLEDPTRAANIMGANFGPNSFRVNVVVGTPVSVLSQSSGQAVLNPAFVYAGMKQDSMSEGLLRAMLNVSVPYRDSIIQITDNRDISDFNSFRYTTMVFNITENQLVIADAPTLAPLSGPGSEFQRQYVMDVTMKAINLVRDICAPFIGLPRTTENLTAMKTKIGLGLKKMVPVNLIDYVPQIIDVPGGEISGRVRVKLNLTTAVEIRNIDIETEIRLGS